MKRWFFVYSIICLPVVLSAQLLPGFSASGYFNEQQILLENEPANTRILINAPIEGFKKDRKVLLILYALPNGNSIEQTMGKSLRPGVDWHFDIQHIAAQTRFLRQVQPKQTIVVAYLEAKQKSWPAWKQQNPAYLQDVSTIVNNISSLFAAWHPQLVLNGHSGGGRFIFSYLDAHDAIPDNITRIAFLDSEYGYEDSLHGPKLLNWLRSNKQHRLTALAYNDSVVIYNGKPLVSPTGGTWYRTKMMKHFLSAYYPFTTDRQDSLLWYSTHRKQVEIILKTNPEKKIYHTVQVERNGFIHSMLSGTKLEERQYRYFGESVYNQFIADTVPVPIRRLHIPQRVAGMETGSEFMRRIDTLPLAQREAEIYKAMAAGNMPGFLSKLVTINDTASDALHNIHHISYQVMPDYLAVGSDDDFCRVPMNPHTAQRLADLFAASLITAKLSDDIYRAAEVKLAPFNYIPVGRANESVEKFVAHQQHIERQLDTAGGRHGALLAGIKKDVILSSRIASQPHKVVIYGWHQLNGVRIQPVYSGHVDWYVDYSHGIRLINDQVWVDGQTMLLSSILTDPALYTLFSNEPEPMQQSWYTTE